MLVEEAKTYREIANTYTSNSQYKNALKYEKKAIGVIREFDDDEQLAINLLNTGYSYYDLDILDSALLLYNEAEPLFDSVGLAIGKAYVVGNRALVYWKQGKPGVAEQDLLKAISMLEPLGDQYGMADYHNQLGNLYLEQGSEEKAIQHLRSALATAKELDLKEQIRDASKLLAQLYAGQADYTQAFAYQTQYLAYKDSIENTETTKKMADLRTEFEVSLKEKEIDLLEKRQVLNRAYIIIAVILLVVAVFVLLYFRQRLINARLVAINERKQHDERVQTLLRQQENRALHSLITGREEERKRIAGELHNHLGSLLATVKVNLNAIEEDSIPNYTTLTTLVDQACSDVRGMSHTLNMGVSEDFGLIPALKDLVEHLRHSGGLQVEFSASMADCPLNSENEIFVYRLVQELVSNVLKHAAATRISISLTCFQEDSLVNIMVQDNGRGFDISEDGDASYEGMGIASMRKMILSRQGEISFDSNPASGTTVSIDLPIEPLSI